MKRSKFETLFRELGLSLGSYQDAAYYGASENFSLVLTPFDSDEVSRAKLAVKAPEHEKRVVVNTFLTAAGVRGAPQIAEAVDSGGDLRTIVDDMEVTLTSIGPEMVLNVCV